MGTVYQRASNDASGDLLNPSDTASPGMQFLSLNGDTPIECKGGGTQLLFLELQSPGVREGEQGFPGELTAMELDAVIRFKHELQAREDRIYHQIVHSFGEVESEAYALCRFLRAQNFDVDKVFDMLDLAKEQFAVARQTIFIKIWKRIWVYHGRCFAHNILRCFAGSKCTVYEQQLFVCLTRGWALLLS